MDSYINLAKDEPITNKHQDLFDISKYTDAIVEFIEGSGTPLTISIQGEWGSGKTSLMNLISNNLKKHTPANYEIVRINTWEFFINDDKEESIERYILSIIQEIINRTDISKLEKEVKNIQNYSKILLSKGFDVLSSLCGIEESTKDVKSLFINNESLMFVKYLRKSLEELIAKSSSINNIHKKFVFLIDDLDRIDPELSIKILEFFKNIFDFQYCIFVLAIDYNIILKGLSKKYADYIEDSNDNIFKDYFDKLIQLPFIIPQKTYKIDRILFDSLLQIQYFDLDEIHFDKRKIIERAIELSVGNNPRKIKRLINAINLSYIFDKRNNLILSNVDRKTLNIFLLCIQQEYPLLYSMLQKFPDYTKWTEGLLSEFVFDFQYTEFMKENLDFNEKWKRFLYTLCLNSKNLRIHTFAVIELFILIDKIIVCNHNFLITRVMSLSDTTHIYSQPVTYNGSDYNNNSFTQFSQGTKLIDLVTCKDTDKVLDIGCGNGLTTIELLNRKNPLTVDAFDISESQIKIAIKNRNSRSISEDQINFFVGDALLLNVHNNYDVIFSNSSLHWIMNAEKMYSIIHSALRSGGLLAVHQGAKNTYLGLHRIVNLAIKNLKLDEFFYNWKFPAFYPSVKEMELLLKSVGFCNIYVEDDETDGNEYSSLIEDFSKASLLQYYTNIPIEYHKKLEEEYFRLCSITQVDKYAHRIYILANKY